MSVKSISGYQVKNRKGMLHWEPLLEEWLLINERYCRVMNGQDAPFLYNERAHVGLLAGAAWRCGRISLEEFQYEKGFVNKPKWSGRADLYMASEDTEELVEAKFRWLSLKPDNLQRLALETLNEGLRDVRQTKGKDDGMTGIGVAFLSFYRPVGDGNQAELEKQINESISSLCQLPCHAIAWSFPSHYRHIESSDRYFTPGVIMLASNTEFAI